MGGVYVKNKTLEINDRMLSPLANLLMWRPVTWEAFFSKGADL